MDPVNELSLCKSPLPGCACWWYVSMEGDGMIQVVQKHCTQHTYHRVPEVFWPFLPGLGGK